MSKFAYLSIRFRHLTLFFRITFAHIKISNKLALFIHEFARREKKKNAAYSAVAKSSIATEWTFFSSFFEHTLITYQIEKKN